MGMHEPAKRPNETVGCTNVLGPQYFIALSIPARVPFPQWWELRQADVPDWPRTDRAKRGIPGLSDPNIDFCFSPAKEKASGELSTRLTQRYIHA